MTERRKLKQTVRARMARTGEPYTTARRHVAGRAARAGRHRESALVRRLLAAAGIDLTEPMICGLGGGIGFLYAVFAYAQLPHPLLTIVAQHHPQPWAPAVLDRLRVGYVEVHSTSTPAAITKLRTGLDSGPVLCTVDRSQLPGHAAVPEFAAADPYPVLVLSTAGDAFDVLDEGHGPVTVPTAVFAQAWAGHRKGRHHLLRITAVPGSLELGEAVRDAVATTVAHLTGPVLGNAFDVNFGLSGMARLAADLRATRGRSSWRSRFGDSVGYALARVVDGVQRELTAADATRPLYADFLDEAAPLLRLPGLPRAVEALRASGRGWAEVSRLAAGNEHADTADVFDRLADLVDECLGHERHAVELLRP
jgi:hypothetical protein